MGLISIAAFMPNPGQEAELLAVLDARLPLLRSLGLATDRAEVRCRARGGAVVSVSEWRDADAVERAHTAPEVLALWQRFEGCCRWVRLGELPESGEDFATFASLD